MSEVELNESPNSENGGGSRISVTLPSFEGPLDLLLHLCQKHELDILDIPIGFVTEKYLEYLSVMELMNLDLASEYLVMAATLAHIKSKMLLPAPPPGQEDELSVEEEDPREALIRRLLEYQKYKKAGEDLQARGVAGRDVFLRGMPIEEAVQTGLPPLAQVQLFSLLDAFQNVLSKSKVKLTHDIVHERITLTDRINELVDVLRARKRIEFSELFDGLETRFDLVITFLALLEMTRLRMTRLFQADFDSGIYVEFTAQVTGDEDVPEPPVEAAPAEEMAEVEPASEAHADDATIESRAPIEDDLDAGDEPTPFENAESTAFTDPPPPEDAESTVFTDPPPGEDEESSALTEPPPGEDAESIAFTIAPPAGVESPHEESLPAEHIAEETPIGEPPHEAPQDESEPQDEGSSEEPT